MKRLVFEGRLGLLRLGCSELDVVRALGAPDFSGGHTRKHQRANVWRYGDVEFGFCRPDYVLGHIAINFSTLDRERPQGGPSLSFDPWVFRKGLSAAEFEATARAENLSLERLSKPWNDDCIEFHAGPHRVHLIFAEDGLAKLCLARELRSSS